jgi:peptidoglycan L-alanyl-D-glutamate endopeptidase CwlK
MPSLGPASMANLVTCDEKIQVICKEAIHVMDFSILEGFRTTDKQEEYFKQGKSKLDGVTVKSKHQSRPSRAVDIMPYPAILGGVNVWEDTRRFYMLAGVMMAVSHSLSILLRWGGDWDSDQNFTEQSFNDLPHFELMGK